MRFSMTMLWLGIKMRLIAAGLVFAIGFYFGIVHAALTRTFWPGSSVFAGLTVFLGLTFLIGLTLPRIGRKTLPVTEFRFGERQVSPVALARMVLFGLTVAVLTSLLIGVLLTHWICRSAPNLPEQFLLTRPAWLLLTFLLPLGSVGIPGVVFGFLTDLIFILFIHLQCPENIRSDEPRVQKVVGAVVAWLVSVVAVGWTFGFLLTQSAPGRGLSLVLIPVIICLTVLLLSLLETAGEERWFRQVRSRRSDQDGAFPELAGGTDRWTGLAVGFLGWFAVWTAAAGSFALSNALGLDPITPDQYLGMALIAVLAAMGGVAWGYRFGHTPVSRYLTGADRQGCAMALLGVVLILAAIGFHSTLTAYSNVYPQLLIPLLLVLVTGLWGINLGLSVPALAIGRPNRVDLWIELVGKLATGALLAGPMHFLWQYWGAGNLLALAFASLVAIAFGGVAVIYDKPRRLTGEKNIRTVRSLHAACIIILYATLGWIIYEIPRLGPLWLRPTIGAAVHMAEGPAGVAYLSAKRPPELVWSNRMVFPERTDAELRAQCAQIARAIIQTTAHRLGIQPEILLVGLPAPDDHAFADSPAARVDHVDFDRALRTLEHRMLGIDRHNPGKDLVDLYCARRPYQVVIALLPDPWPIDRSWPGAEPLLSRLTLLAQKPETVWILSLAQGPSDPTPATGSISLQPLLQKCVNPSFGETILDGRTGRRWVLRATPSALADLGNLYNNPSLSTFLGQIDGTLNPSAKEHPH